MLAMKKGHSSFALQFGPYPISLFPFSVTPLPLIPDSQLLTISCIIPNPFLTQGVVDLVKEVAPSEVYFCIEGMEPLPATAAKEVGIKQRSDLL